MLLPTTLPTAMPGEPFMAPVTLATSSGVEVPKPTRVRPMSSDETPMRLASVTEPRTSSSAPTTSSTSPRAISA